MQSILTNWKTTLGGLAAWLLLASQIIHDLSTAATLPDVLTPQNALFAIVGAIGIVAKDFNVTGK